MSDPIKETKDAALTELIKDAAANPDIRAAGQHLAGGVLTVAKTLSTVLLPLAALNFGIEKARRYFNETFPDEFGAKAANIPQENIVEPKSSIAGPALQALAFSHEEENLKEMYLTLLANAVDSRSAATVHPSFVHIIQQLTPPEARILKVISVRFRRTEPLFAERIANLAPPPDKTASNFYLRFLTPPHEEIAESWNSFCRDCEAIEQDLAQTYLSNLKRLGILADSIVNAGARDSLSFLAGRVSGSAANLTRELRLTDYGNLFLDSCVRDEPKIREPKESRN